MQCGDCFDQHHRGLLFGRGIVTSTARYHEELSGIHPDRSSVRVASPDTQETGQNQKHLVFEFMGVPWKLADKFHHFDVLIVDLPYNSRRAELLQSGARECKRNRGRLGNCLLKLWLCLHVRWGSVTMFATNRS